MDGCLNIQDPPQPILSLGDTVSLVDEVTTALSQGHFISLQPSILLLSSSLKLHGSSLELQHSSHLDRLQLVLRSSCRDHKLDLMSRVLLLEILELRTFNWAPSQQVSNYYKLKIQQINNDMLAGDPHPPPAHHHSKPPYSHHSNPPYSHHSKPPYGNVRSPSFHLGTSHLLMNIPNRQGSPNHYIPSRQASPNHYISNRQTSPNHFIPNHIAAPNSFGPNGLINLPNRPPASNLLMTSPNPTTTSNLFYPDRSPPFMNLQPPPQRNPFQDNLRSNLPNTPNSGDKVNLENTDNSGDDPMEETGDKSEEKRISVHAKGGDLLLTSVSTDLLHTVKQILQEELADEILPKSLSSSTSSLGSSKPELVYQKPELLELASSPLCREPPKDWENIFKEIPAIVKKGNNVLKGVPHV